MPEYRHPRWPWCIVFADADQWAGVIIRWETGYGQSPGEWLARVVYVKDGRVVEELVPAGRVKRAGG